MIVNSDKTIQYIKDWISDYLKTNNKTLIVISGDIGYINVRLLSIICKQITNFKTQTLNDPYAFAENNNGIILSPIDRTYGYLGRRYDKYTLGNCDLYPLLDLYRSEIIDLVNDLNCDSIIYDRNDYEYADYEWADIENQLTGIIENDILPHLTSNWFKYTMHQKEIISNLHQREKRTRHKKIFRPMLKIRHRNDLVK